MKPLDPDARFVELDLKRLGEVLVMLALTSRQLGHSNAVCTVRDYWHHDGSAEHEFVRDVFMLDPEEIAGLWFGGTDNAVRLTSAILTHGKRQLSS